MLPWTRIALCTALSLLLYSCSAGFNSNGSGSGDGPPDDDDSVVDDDDSGADDDDSGDDDSGDDDAGDDDAGDDDAANPVEGDDPGECTDGADNDQDGLVDCDDPSCWDSPDCTDDGDDDTGSGDDDTGSDDDDTGSDDDDTGSDDDDTGSDDDDAGIPYEGDDPGECTDGADNDQDGLFDCDDPNCWGSPDCAGTGDDDDTGSDDDDSTPISGAPVILNVTWTWIASTSSFEFVLDLQDSDCNLSPVTLYWSANGAAETAQAPISDAGIACGTQLTFTLELFNAASGQNYNFAFRVTDGAGNSSAVYSLSAQVP